jgi:hypothetical protein
MTIQVASAGVNVARDGHYETVAGVAARCLLLELARTNNFTFSDDLTQAAWVKYQCSAIANVTAAPDGSSGGNIITESAVNDVHEVQRGLTTVDNENEAVTFFAKPGGRSWIFVQITYRDGSTATSWINLATASRGTTAVTHAVRLTPYLNGWVGVELVTNAKAGGSTMLLTIGTATGDGGLNYLGDGASGIGLWRLGHERGALFGSQSIATAGATASRSVDAFSLPFPYTPQAMTLYLKFVERGTITVPSAAALYVGNAGNTGARLWIDSTGTAYRLNHHNGTTLVQVTLATGPTIGDSVELRAVLNVDGSIQLGQSINSAAETTTATSAVNALATAWSDTLCYLNTTGTTNPGAIAVQALKAMRGVPTLTALRAA